MSNNAFTWMCMYGRNCWGKLDFPLFIRNAFYIVNVHNIALHIDSGLHRNLSLKVLIDYQWSWHHLQLETSHSIRRQLCLQNWLFTRLVFVSSSISLVISLSNYSTHQVGRKSFVWNSNEKNNMINKTEQWRNYHYKSWTSQNIFFIKFITI